MNRIKLKEVAELYGSAEQLSLEDTLYLLLGQSVKAEALQALIQLGATDLMELSFEEMLALGLTKAQAYKLKGAISLTRKFQKGAFIPNMVIRSPEDAANVAIQYLQGMKQEHFVAMFLDTKNQVKHFETIFIGSLNASIVHRRELYACAVKMSCAGILVFHNHPSQSLSPSPEDIDVTHRLAAAGEILGIPLIDHLIVNDTGFYSLKEHGLF